MEIALTLLVVVLDVYTSAHILLHKRDARSASAWIGMTWLAPPFVGPVLYYLFGINRIHRRARKLISAHPRIAAAAKPPVGIQPAVPPQPGNLDALVRVGGRVNGRLLLPGNSVDPLINGDSAYPAMLEAIAGARRSITLCSYIFDNDPVGREFVDALGDAHRRGVAVRVLVDDVGARYSFPSIFRKLRQADVRCAAFLPALAPWRAQLLNLRNHRKLMVVDSGVAFTGGMNLRRGHWLARAGSSPIQDVHFRLRGPIVAALQETFAADWEFSTGERLEGPPWFDVGAAAGGVLARAVPDGPEPESEHIHGLILGALAAAQHSVRVQTPYFVPDASLVSALNTAALRGTEVHILLPERGNLPWVQWAARAMLWQVLTYGCRVWLAPPPFDHGKLMIVDGAWSMFGSANWDVRSLRLNFELNVECFDASLAGRLDELFREKQSRAREVTLAEMDGRPFPQRLRDGFAHLFSPYL